MSTLFRACCKTCLQAKGGKPMAKPATTKMAGKGCQTYTKGKGCQTCTTGIHAKGAKHTPQTSRME
eukprot:6480583-Amphidinium_carterae.1